MPALVLALSLFVLSQSGIFVRTAAAHVVAIGFWRMVIVLPVLGVLLAWHKQWPLLIKLRPRQWAWLALCGFFLFTHFYTWFLSVQMTSLAHSMILFCSNPIYTAIGAWIFFAERASLRHVISLLICFGGIYLLLSDKAGHHDLVGDAYGIACALLFSAYVLVGKNLRRELPNLPFVSVVYASCAFYFLVAMLALGLPFLGYGPASWASFAALAFGSTLLGHSLLTYSLQHFHVNLVSISTLVEPVFTAISAYLIFGEPLTAMSVAGFVLVLSGMLVLYAPYLKEHFRCA